MKKETKSGSTHYKDIKNIKIKRDKEIIGFSPFDGKPATPAQEQIASSAIISSDCGSVTPDQKLFSDIVEGLYATYFQNPEGKYKNVVKARFNLSTGENPEFIAFMTKRWADFRRNIEEDIINWMNVIRKDIKADYRIHPYMGKFALRRGQNEDSPKIEPDTAIALWYDRFDEKWMAVIKFKSFEMLLNFETEYLTEKQKSNNVRATALYRKNIKRTKSWSDMNSEYK